MYSANPLRPPLAEVDSVAHSLMVLSRVYHYNHWIYNSVRPFIRGSVLEVGSGVGNITQFLLNHPHVTCLEPNRSFAVYLRERFSDHQNLQVCEARVEQLPNHDLTASSFDSVLCANVLEHIQSDQAALDAMTKMVRPGGLVALVVPALSFIYGRLDERLGHFRRYSRGRLRGMFAHSGLRVIRARYFNLAGVLGWWLQGKVLRHERIPERQTRIFDQLVPWLSAAERLIPPPLGQSVVVIGEKSKIPAGANSSKPYEPRL